MRVLPASEPDVPGSSIWLVPWRRDHLFSALESHAAGPCWLLVGWLVLMGGLVLVNLVQNTLVHPEGARLLGRDLVAVLLRGKPLDDVRFPFFRDSATLVVLTLLTVNFSILYLQWTALGDLIPDLQKAEVLQVVNRSFLADAVAYANGKWEAACRSNVSLIVAFILALALQGAQYGFGIFWSLAPKGLSGFALSEWSHKAYTNWWASLPDHWVGFAAYLVTASVVMYYVIAQNHVGIRVCLLFWKQRHNLSFHYNTAKVDGRYGWQPLRRVMWTVYPSLMINTVVLVWMIHMIAPPLALGTAGAMVWAIPWLFLLFVLGPCYIVVPYCLVAPKLRRRRKELEERLVHELEELGSDSPDDPTELFHRRHQIREEIEWVRKLPTFPVRIKWVVIAYVVTVASGVNTLLSLSNLLFGWSS